MGNDSISAVEVWSIEDCPRCAEAKNRLRAAGVNVRECDLEDVRRAKVRDVDVLAQTAMQNDAAPVLRVIRAGGERSDEFIEPAALDTWLAEYRGDE